MVTLTIHQKINARSHVSPSNDTTRFQMVNDIPKCNFEITEKPYNNDNVALPKSVKQQFTK